MSGDFDAIDAWVFDLDNTLYPHELGLWRQVDERIRRYIMDMLKVDADEAHHIQKDYYKRYGTTLRGLMTEHGMAPEAYLEFLHDIDHSVLQPNPALGRALTRLPGRKLIVTNATRKHAEAIVARLGVAGYFDGIFDIMAAGLEPKPKRIVYERFLTLHGVDPARAAMFEDLARNLEVPHALGMATVLVVSAGTRDLYREDWEREGRDAPYVDHVTDDLVGFLEGIVGARD
jgi:putative hydrolase of the HAD superfamily